jgi:hypothetical protein
MAGLFHFQMAIVGLLFRAHRVRDEDYGSLHHWMVAIRRNCGMWNFQTNKLKDFRACGRFLDHLLDAHVLAAVGFVIGARDWVDLCEKLPKTNWRKAIQKVEELFGSPDAVGKWRQKSPELRDLVHENTVLMLQHLLRYRRFSDALRTGDSGWAVHCLKYFTIWLQNDEKTTSLPNYRAESMHIMASLTHTMSCEFRENYMDNCLMNFSGYRSAFMLTVVCSPTEFMPIDRGCKEMVRQHKMHLHANFTTATDHYHRRVFSPQLPTAKAVCEHFYKATGAVEHYQHSSTTVSVTDVSYIANSLLHESVFVNEIGWKNYSQRSCDTPIQSAVDLYWLGGTVIMKGQRLEAFKEKTLRRRVDVRVEEENDNAHEILDSDHVEYDDGPED